VETDARAKWPEMKFLTRGKTGLGDFDGVMLRKQSPAAVQPQERVLEWQVDDADDSM